MADRVVPGPVDSSASIREAVCIHTRKIYSSCRDKDCVEDLRVYPTASSNAYIETALSIRPRSAELLHTSVDVEEITFNRGYYAVDVTYFYRINGEAFPGGRDVTGLAVFNKRCILFGSEGSARVFTSDGAGVSRSEQPIAVVEAVDPIALSMKILDSGCNCPPDVVPEVPNDLLSTFGETLVFTDAARQWYVTLGQFSLVRLERDSQLVIPVYNYCIPDNECAGSASDDPCTLFSRIRFPVEEFYPPDNLENGQSYRSLLQ